jgi:acetate kinase
MLPKRKKERKEGAKCPTVSSLLNAGSSSIMFSLFLDRGACLEAETRGQIEGLYTAARFVAKNKDGAVKYEKSWPAGAQLGHDGALDYLVA